MSSDSHIISELISKYGEHATRRIISNANNYFYDLDRKKEEKDQNEILENPAVLAYIEHFKSWINAEVKKAGYQLYKTKESLNFESMTYDMGFYSLVNVRFDYAVCLLPTDLKKKSFLTIEREERDFRYNLPHKFYEKHPPLRYLELSRDNQYGYMLDLYCDVSNLPNYELAWPFY